MLGGVLRRVKRSSRTANLFMTGPQLDRLTEAYLGEVIPLAEYQRRRKDLEQRGEALASQERQLQGQGRQRMELAGVADSIEDFCERVRAGLAEATFEQRRKLVELLIDRVIVTDEDVEIRYVIPTDSSSEQVRFCHLRSDYLYHPTLRCLEWSRLAFQGDHRDKATTP
jgi:site-specific DNA recombinase